MIRALAVLAALMLAGCLGTAPATEPIPGAEPEGEPNPELVELLDDLRSFPEMRIETDFGTIRMVLFTEWTPQTAAHIGELADSGFYDGLTFHRVVDDFVIQGGDPTGTGEGGSGPGGASTNMVPLEIHEGLEFGVGAVGLARWTDDTGDSQFFITEQPAPHLHDPQGAVGDALGAYSMFGQVFEGIDVVREIAGVETIQGADRPVDDVVMNRVELLPPPADMDVLGVVRDVTVADACELDWPRHILAGHQFTIRVHGCTNNRIQFQHTDGGAHQIILEALPTGGYEGTLTVPNDGSFEVGFGFGPDSVVFTQRDVHPWHEAYAA